MNDRERLEGEVRRIISPKPYPIIIECPDGTEMKIHIRAISAADLQTATDVLSDLVQGILYGAFEAVKKTLDRVTDSTKRAQLEAKIFGEEHAKVGLAILSNTRLLGQYEVSLKGTNIAQEQAAIRLKTFNKRWERLGILVKDIVIRTFLRLEPILTKQMSK